MTIRTTTSRRFPGAGLRTRTIQRQRRWIAQALGAFALRVRERAAEEIRYRQALRELRRLDDRTLDDLALGRADLPGIARRHARATVPA
jgi:uncharacterized protein YjiS (DUF1127 family)